jgi:putative transposase
LERWVGLITQHAIRRGSFFSFKELIAKIEQFVSSCGKAKVMFKWTAIANSILEKFQRLYSQISGEAHS